jgi:hypothetical protein
LTFWLLLGQAKSDKAPQLLSGEVISEPGTKLIATTTSHTLEKTGTKMRLTFGVVDLEFTEDDISFWDLIKLLPK